MVVPSTSRRLIFTPAARRYNNNNTKQVMHTLEKVIEKPRCIEKQFGFNKCDETKWNYVMFAGIGNVPSTKSGQGAIIKERGRRFGAWPVHTIQQVRILSIVGKQLMIASLTISLWWWENDWKQKESVLSCAWIVNVTNYYAV